MEGGSHWLAASLLICLRLSSRNSYFTCSLWHKQYFLIYFSQAVSCDLSLFAQGRCAIKSEAAPPSPGRSLTSFRRGLPSIIYRLKKKNTLHCKIAEHPPPSKTFLRNKLNSLHVQKDNAGVLKVRLPQGHMQKWKLSGGLPVCECWYGHLDV